MKEKERKCKKCGTLIICTCGCIPNPNFYDKGKRKEINYTICGEACRFGAREKCIKCGTEFEIQH